jgi:replicative DNA helicase
MLANRDTIETGLLCAALCGPEFVAAIQSQTTARAIRNGDRAAYWSILQRRAESGEPFDLDTILDECERKKLNLQVIADLQAARFEIPHIGYYCEQLNTLNEADDLRQLGELLARDQTPNIDGYITRLDALRRKTGAQVITQLEAIQIADEMKNNEDATHPTGIKQLDAMLGGGLRAGQLIVVGGRPGAGKSVLMLQMLLGSVSPAQAGLVVTLEMKCGEMIERLRSRYDETALANLNLLYIDSSSDLGAIQGLITTTARRLNLCGVVVDYLQLLEVANGGENREREIARASRQMKRLAMDLGLPVIVGSQLNRNSERSGKPTLADLRESGAIEQDADIVILLSKDQDSGETFIDVAKHRRGKTGQVNAKLDGAKFQFVEDNKFAEYDRWGH